MKKLFLLICFLFVFVSTGFGQVGYFGDALKSSVDSTTTFQVIAANTVTSQVFQFIPGPDGYPGSQFPDVISGMYDINSRNDSINVTFKLQLSQDGTNFHTWTTDLGSKTVSGAADSEIFSRHTTVPAFRYGKVQAVGAMAAGDTLDIKIYLGKEYQ